MHIGHRGCRAWLTGCNSSVLYGPCLESRKIIVVQFFSSCFRVSLQGRLRAASGEALLKVQEQVQPARSPGIGRLQDDPRRELSVGDRRGKKIAGIRPPLGPPMDAGWYDAGVSLHHTWGTQSDWGCRAEPSVVRHNGRSPEA